MSTSPSRSSKSIMLCQALALLYVAMYFIAWIWPESWWGIHYLAFLPPSIAASIAFAALAIGALLYKKHAWISKFFLLSNKQAKHLLPVTIALLCGLLFLLFPIAFDKYGDAFMWQEMGKTIETEFNVEWLSILFSIDFLDYKVGQRTLLNLAAIISYLSGFDMKTCVSLIAALAGIGYVYLWLRFISKRIKEPYTQFILGLIGISGPFMLNFFGHFELYAPVLVAQLGLGMCLFAYFKQASRRNLIIFGVMVLVNMKLHISGYLFLLPAAIMGIIHFIPSLSWDRFTARSLWSYVLQPVFIVGLLAYIFIIGDFNDPRDLYDDPNIKERLFLPIMGPIPPLDRYNLFSFNHIFDFFQSMLIGPGVAILFGLCAGIYFKQQIQWQHPRNLILGLQSILFLLLFFFINPLVSMPFDWDLFCLFTVPLLLLLVGLMQGIDSQYFSQKLIGFITAIVLLNSSCFIMHQQKDAIAERYISLGKYVFKTYWVASNRDIEYGFAHLYKDSPNEAVLAERQAQLEELKPWVVWGNDPEYSELLKETGKHLLRAMNKPQEAIAYLRQAQDCAPFHFPPTLILTEALYIKGDYTSALAEAKKLIELDKDHQARAYRMVIQCALKVPDYEQAASYAEAYLAVAPNDPAAQELYQRFQERATPAEILSFFEKV